MASETNKNVNIPVPSWRIKEYTPTLCNEGTEDLSDEVFLERHRPFAEMEAKLNSRIRKKLLAERLEEEKKRRRKRGRPTSSQWDDDDEEIPTSPWPSLEHVKAIEIVDKLPPDVIVAEIPPPADSYMLQPPKPLLHGSDHLPKDSSETLSSASQLKDERHSYNPPCSLISDSGSDNRILSADPNISVGATTKAKDLGTQTKKGGAKKGHSRKN